MKYPGWFENVSVIDCGSRNINGTLKDLFDNSRYMGVDFRAGANVDVVSHIHELPYHNQFDTVVSASTLEHSEFWRDDLRKMYQMAKPGGLVAIATVCRDFPEHGTAQNPDAGNIYGTRPDYYRNLGEADIRTVYEDGEFEEFFISETADNDLFIWGIKK